MRNPQGQEQASEVLMLVLGALVIAGVIAYAIFRSEVNAALLQAAGWMIRPFAWMHFPHARHDAGVIAALPQRAGRLGAGDIFEVFTAVGRFWRWPVLLGLIVFGVWGWMVGVERYRTSYSLRKLLQFNARPERFPCLAPVAHRRVDLEPLHKGPWRAALSPLEWAVEQALLIDSKTDKPADKALFLRARDGFVREKSPVLKKREWKGRIKLDRDGAKKALEAQLGPAFQGFDHMVAHRQALAAVFLAWGQGDTKGAGRLLDQMSLSFEEGEAPGEFKLDTSGAEELIAAHWPLDELDMEELGPHDSFEMTLLCSLLKWARNRGSLPVAQFIWLRPADRSLFYALSSVGRRAPFAEAAGVWAHMDAEAQLGEALLAPEVEQALVGLAGVLSNEGWIEAEGGN